MDTEEVKIFQHSETIKDPRVRSCSVKLNRLEGYPSIQNSPRKNLFSGEAVHRPFSGSENCIVQMSLAWRERDGQDKSQFGQIKHFSGPSESEKAEKGSGLIEIGDIGRFLKVNTDGKFYDRVSESSSAKEIKREIPDVYEEDYMPKRSVTHSDHTSTERNTAGDKVKVEQEINFVRVVHRSTKQESQSIIENSSFTDSKSRTHDSKGKMCAVAEIGGREESHRGDRARIASRKRSLVHANKVERRKKVKIENVSGPTETEIFTNSKMTSSNQPMTSNNTGFIHQTQINSNSSSPRQTVVNSNQSVPFDAVMNCNQSLPMQAIPNNDLRFTSETTINRNPCLQNQTIAHCDTSVLHQDKAKNTAQTHQVVAVVGGKNMTSSCTTLRQNTPIPQLPINGSQLPVNGSLLQRNGSQLQMNGSQPSTNGSVQPKSGSMQPTNGSVILVNGSRLPVNGSVLPMNSSQPSVNGSMLLVNGVQLPVDGSQLPVNGSMLLVNGSNLPVDGSQLPVNGSMLLVNSSHLPMNDSQLPVNCSQLLNRTKLPMNGSVQQINISSLPVNGSIKNSSGQNQPNNAVKQTTNAGSFKGLKEIFSQSKSVNEKSEHIIRSVLPVNGSTLPMNASVLPVTSSVLPINGSVLPVNGAVLQNSPANNKPQIPMNGNMNSVPIQTPIDGNIVLQANNHLIDQTKIGSTLISGIPTNTIITPNQPNNAVKQAKAAGSYTILKEILLQSRSVNEKSDDGISEPSTTTSGLVEESVERLDEDQNQAQTTLDLQCQDKSRYSLRNAEKPRTYAESSDSEQSDDDDTSDESYEENSDDYDTEDDERVRIIEKGDNSDARSSTKNYLLGNDPKMDIASVHGGDLLHSGLPLRNHIFLIPSSLVSGQMQHGHIMDSMYGRGTTSILESGRLDRNAEPRIRDHYNNPVKSEIAGNTSKARVAHVSAAIMPTRGKCLKEHGKNLPESSAWLKGQRKSCIEDKELVEELNVLDKEARTLEDKWKYTYGEEDTFSSLVIHKRQGLVNWRMCVYDDSEAFRRCFEFVEWNCFMKCIVCNKIFETFAAYIQHSFIDTKCSKKIRGLKRGRLRACVHCKKYNFLKNGFIRHMLLLKSHGSAGSAYVPKPKFLDCFKESSQSSSESNKSKTCNELNPEFNTTPESVTTDLCDTDAPPTSATIDMCNGVAPSTSATSDLCDNGSPLTSAITVICDDDTPSTSVTTDVCENDEGIGNRKSRSSECDALSKKNTRVGDEESATKDADWLNTFRPGFQCKVCTHKTHVFLSLHDAIRHIKRQHTHEEKSKLLYRRFINYRGKEKLHVKRTQSTAQDEGFLCPICGTVLRHKASFRSHLASMHKDIPAHELGIKDKIILCQHCGKSYSVHNQRQYRRHMLTHTDPVKCDKCDAVLKNRGAYQRHRIAMHRDVTYTCKECGKVCKNQPSYTQHKKNHKLNAFERKYQCEVCDKTFMYKHHLANHSVIHSADRRFECDDCGMTFKLKHHLKNHLEKACPKKK
ncbi:hypothetical protein FSP39_019814 [Pinctada imbricata]|uniref:C2H2-type domain-containing protein n=1 Tax=Pinctada imbricata TaxID=66713 RepID=A0AA89C491_PINIB|nr:hypothetical protein FSP39_019814 [Pinctada imbricata]